MNESKATRYQRLRRRARAAGTASMALALAAIAFTPVGRWLADLAVEAGAGWTAPAAGVISLLVFAVPVIAAMELAALPAGVYEAQRVEGAYTTQPPRMVEDVVWAQIQSAMFALPLVLVAGGAVRFSVATAGAWWWIVAGALLALALAGALWGIPGVLGRLATLRPIARPELASRLMELAQRADVQLGGISEWVVTAATPPTAFVTGVGKAKRVLLSSELARTWADEEIAVVVAHELAHHAHRDLWRTLGLNVVLLSAALLAGHLVVSAIGPSLGLAGPGDLAALPVIALSGAVVWAATAPLRNAQSRRQERKADAFALSLTGQADAFRTAIRRLEARHLAEDRPSVLTTWLYHRHPSVAERLALADTYRTAGAARRQGAR